MEIREYFKDKSEGGSDTLFCSCGCGMKPNYEALEMLYVLRIYWNRPLLVSSGARCWDNHCRIYEELGRTPYKRSKHLDGIAFDIKLPKKHHGAFKRMAKEVGFLGIGTYSWGVHIDLRDYKSEW